MSDIIELAERLERMTIDDSQWRFVAVCSEAAAALRECAKQNPLDDSWAWIESARKDREAALSQWRKASDEIARLRSLLAECRRWVDLSPYHDPDHGPNCHVCRRLDRIDAALEESK